MYSPQDLFITTSSFLAIDFEPEQQELSVRSGYFLDVQLDLSGAMLTNNDVTRSSPSLLLHQTCICESRTLNIPDNRTALSPLKKGLAMTPVLALIFLEMPEPL